VEYERGEEWGVIVRKRRIPLDKKIGINDINNLSLFSSL